MTTALVNGLVLLPTGFTDGHAVLIEGAHIAAILPMGDTRVKRSEQHDLAGKLLLPGFIDVQVNGGGGVLFNDAPDIDSILAIGKAHRRFGTTGFLPTLISDDLDVVRQGLAAAQAAIDAGVPGMLGIHIEGPFLNVERKGIHNPAKLRRLDEAALESLRPLRGGRTLVTLAPEMTTPAIIRKLADAGIIVAVGHTNATYAQVRAALDHGARGFTHLFNAMSPLTSREPGAVGAALEDFDSWCGLIVDGMHVAPTTLRIALRCKPADRFMLVTDAMPGVGTGADSFTLQGQHIRIRDGRCVDENGTLAGSNLGMSQAVANTRRLLGLDLAQCVRMASAHPAAFLGLEGETGRIAPGFRANLVQANDALDVTATWIDGRPSGEDWATRPRVLQPLVP